MKFTDPQLDTLTTIMVEGDVWCDQAEKHGWYGNRYRDHQRKVWYAGGAEHGSVLRTDTVKRLLSVRAIYRDTEDGPTNTHEFLGSLHVAPIGAMALREALENGTLPHLKRLRAEIAEALGEVVSERQAQ